MSHLYNCKFKIGKRTFTDKLYADNDTAIISFCEQAYQAELIELHKQVKVPITVKRTIPVDDVLNYKPSMYMIVSNTDLKKSKRFIFQTVKLKHSINDLLGLMKLYLKIDATTSIKGLLTASVSSR